MLAQSRCRFLSLRLYILRYERQELHVLRSANAQPVTRAVLPARSAPLKACNAVVLELRKGAMLGREYCQDARVLVKYMQAGSNADQESGSCYACRAQITNLSSLLHAGHCETRQSTENMNAISTGVIAQA